MIGGKWPDFCGIGRDAGASSARIPRYPTALPEYDDNSEREYNERVANSRRQPICVNGRKDHFLRRWQMSSFAIYNSREKDIIQVKRDGGSNIFSHLFAQGTTSAELFQTQPAIRDLVNQQLPLSHKLTDCTKRPDAREYQVVFAVVSDSDEPDLTIPFFARLNLRAAVRRLDGYGYRVAITSGQSTTRNGKPMIITCQNPCIPLTR